MKTSTHFRQNLCQNLNTKFSDCKSKLSHSLTTSSITKNDVNKFCSGLFLALLNDCAEIRSNHNEDSGGISKQLSIMIVIGLVLLSGLFSGLTLGLLGLDLAGLKIIIEGGSNLQKKYALRILSIRKNGNQLLCTLLLGNVAVNAGLAILLDSLFVGAEQAGFFVSTCVITIVGEILPQAIFSRHSLVVGYYTRQIVILIMVVLFPVAWPISKVLDQMLGEELGTIYSNEELKELVRMHVNQEKAELGFEEGRIMRGALNYTKLTVADIMTPQKDVEKILITEKLNFNTLTRIFKSGHSRIPCIDNNTEYRNSCGEINESAKNLSSINFDSDIKEKCCEKIAGLLFVKDLILIDPEDEVPVSTIINLYERSVPFVFPEESVQHVMNLFKTGRSHLAIVRSVNNEGENDPFYYNVGIITLEDIVEAILQVEIVDETDVYIRIGEKNPVQREPFDISKLNVFDYRRRLPLSLTPQEAQAIYFHLSGSVKIFRPGEGIVDSRKLKTLISNKNVSEIIMELDNEEKINQRLDKDIFDNGLMLYKRNVPNNYFTLLLDGRIRIEATKEGFQSELSRQSTLGEDVLQLALSNQTYIPDFNAYVQKNSRVLRISKEEFLSTLNPSKTQM